MDYAHYTTEDFMLDEAFQTWVFRPAPPADQFWHAFLEQYPEQAAVVAEARSRLQAVRFREHEPDAAIQSRVRARLQHHLLTARPQPSNRRSLRPRPVFPYLVAACLTLLAVASIGLWHYLANPYVEYRTANAETRQVWLPDSTRVTLNANSSLRLPQDTDQPRREVWLEGEAFFEVAHNAQRPFIVYADQTQVRVTGTTFNVANRAQNTQVVLASGEVRLTTEASPQPLTLVPGDLVAYDKRAGTVRQRTVAPDQYTAWRDRVYFFREAALPEVAEVIENYYGMPVHISPALIDLTFTARVTLEDHPDDLLTLLSETLDLKIRAGQHQIFISQAP